jgi:MraZ protein
MNHFLGEYECKLDTKGRMVLPAALKRQMPDVEREGLVINRGLESHLVIYTRAEWNRIMDKLSGLNQFERKSRDFIRKFMRGATELTLDSAGRVLIPKTLQAYAGISTEVVLASQFNKIEVWAKERYDELWEDEGEEFAALAEEVMGNLERRKDEE